MSSDASKYLRLAKSVVPTVLVPIVWFAQAGDNVPPLFLFLMIGMVGLSIATVVTKSGIIKRSSRAGRSDEICEGVAARGRDVADDILANRSSDL